VKVAWAAVAARLLLAAAKSRLGARNANLNLDQRQSTRQL
jgi:hypothetical protein